jgi:peptidyl-prolyl cis-trans isomerase C
VSALANAPDFQGTVMSRTSLSLAAAALVLAGALGAAHAPARAQSPAPLLLNPAPAVPPPSADTVIARVDGQPILRSEMQSTMRGLPPQAQGMPMETLYPMLLERVIDLRLLGTASRAARLDADPAIKQKVAEATDRIMQEAYLTREVERKVNEAALRERYKTFAASVPGQEEVNARHILLKTEPEAKAVIAELKKGGDFADVAKRRSIDPAASNGGDLGYFTKEQMVPEFSEVAFKLKKGEMTEVPVKTNFGWHVIKVEDRRMGGAPTFEEAREELAEAMSREVIQDLIKDLRDKAKVERFNMDGTPKAP